jgi:hypothetical protein
MPTFESQNDFKLKIYQLKSFITFRDLQLIFWFPFDVVGEGILRPGGGVHPP